LPPEIGQTVVATATLVFLILLVSGFMLWYSKNKNAAKQRFWYQWNESTRWKRKNYDVHNITGFYILIIEIIFTITGLVWDFNSLQTSITKYPAVKNHYYMKRLIRKCLPKKNTKQWQTPWTKFGIKCKKNILKQNLLKYIHPQLYLSNSCQC
jgi:uncharacterized iron-regulated membrane protein